MLKFYVVDKNYINYLKQYDQRIINKVVCGIVFTNNEINYYAPISHDVYKSSYDISIFAKINLSRMFPAEQAVLTEIPIKDDSDFRIYQINEKDIKRQAEKIYMMIQYNRHRNKDLCCNFQFLESIYRNYQQN